MEKKQVISWIKIFLTVVGLITELLALLFGFLNNAPRSLETRGNTTTVVLSGVFQQTIESLNAKYPSNVNPAAWVFVVIWPLIFLWNTIGSLYMTASLCLPKDRSPVLRNPSLVPIASLVAWIFAWGGSLGWLFLYDREYFGVALFFLIMATLSSYVFLAFTYRSVQEDIQLLDGFSKKMLWLVRILIHNGFAVYATWVTCAWKLNLATVITYVDSRGIDKIPADMLGSLTAEDAGTIALALLMFELIFWFILENFVFEKHCRYTLTVYPVLIFVFSGIYVGNYVSPFSRNQVITLTALILACVAFVARVALVIYRHRNTFLYA